MAWRGAVTELDVQQLLHEYRIHSAEVLFREDCTIDQFIDLIEGNRKYVRCLYVYNSACHRIQPRRPVRHSVAIEAPRCCLSAERRALASGGVWQRST